MIAIAVIEGWTKRLQISCNSVEKGWITIPLIPEFVPLVMENSREVKISNSVIHTINLRYVRHDENNIPIFKYDPKLTIR